MLELTAYKAEGRCAYFVMLLHLCSISPLVVVSASTTTSSSRKEDCAGITGDPVCDAINDERTFAETFFTSRICPYVTGFSGSISTISSVLIIVIILRSNIGLSKISHRLVFAMSIADIISSTAMAAGTLAMPKDMVYDFNGLVLGNQFTCNLQAFLAILGGSATIPYNACLCIYFMCSISYKMKETTMRRCFEPATHVLCFLFTLSFAVLPWIHKWYNPTPYQPWCFIMAYPYYCREEADLSADTCTVIRGPAKDSFPTRKMLSLYYAFTLSLGPIVAVCCMARIFGTVYSQKKRINSDLRLLRAYNSPLVRLNLSTPSDERSRMLEIARKRHTYTKVMMIQCIGYIFANVIPIGIQLAQTIPRKSLEQSKLGSTLQVLYAILRPSQGFLNFIVFFSQKIHDRRRLDSDLTRVEAAKMVLLEREEPNFELSGISLVRVHQHGTSDRPPSDNDFDDEELDDANKNSMNDNLDIVASSGGDDGPAITRFDSDEPGSYDASRLRSLDDLNQVDRFSSNSNSEMSCRVSWKSGSEKRDGEISSL